MKKKIRFCIVCETPLARWAKKFCSKKCEGCFRHNKSIQDWKDGKISGIHGILTSKSIKRYLIETHGEKCSLCGWAERHPITGKVPVQLDHIDGNWQNNKEENLRLLCPNCHSLTETFGALNKGHGRTERYLPQ